MIYLNRILNFLRYQFHNTLKWSRAGYIESPVHHLNSYTVDQQVLIQKLKTEYAVDFEKSLSFENTLDNYFYLSLLDASQKLWQFVTPHTHILDVGCKNFYYAATLEAFFKPESLTGIEVDGYTIYQDGHSRKNYAESYLKPYRNAHYIVEDIFKHTYSYNGITCFYPFLFPETAVKWSLPLSFFNPQKFFQKIESLLKPQGFFWMLNHGEEEWEAAQKIISHTTLTLVGDFTTQSILSSCETEACVSLWRKSI